MKLILFLVGLCPVLAMAENSFFASLYNQWNNDAFCFTINKEDLTSSGFNCSIQNQTAIQRAGSYAEITMLNLIFMEAVKKQIDKNQCLAQQIAALKKHEDQLSRYRAYLAKSWLGLKKAQLQLATCQRIFLDKVDRADIKRLGLGKSWDRMIHRRKAIRALIRDDSKRDMDDALNKWKPVCTDGKTLSALSVANEIFGSTLPVVSTPKILATMEKHRNLLVSIETGHPLTDAELLEMDLRGSLAEKVRLDGSDEMIRAMTSELDKAGEGRAALANELAGVDSVVDLTETQNDYLFRDGTLDEVLRDNRLKDTKTEACLNARFEKTFGGFIADAAATTMITGPFFSSIARISTLYKAGSAAAVSLGGFTAVGLAGGAYYASGLQAIKAVHEACLSKWHRQSGLVNVESRSRDIRRSASELPADLGYRRFILDLPGNEIPACHKDKNQKLIHDSAVEADCMHELLNAAMLPLPLSIALPVMAIDPTGEH